MPFTSPPCSLFLRLWLRPRVLATLFRMRSLQRLWQALMLRRRRALTLRVQQCSAASGRRHQRALPTSSTLRSACRGPRSSSARCGFTPWLTSLCAGTRCRWAHACLARLCGRRSRLQPGRLSGRSAWALRSSLRPTLPAKQPRRLAAGAMACLHASLPLLWLASANSCRR